MPPPADVERHYASGGIAERILAALRAVHGPDAVVNPAALAPLDHFHGRGLAATEELVARLDPRPGEHLLDIGAGIGGPARWIADRFGCRVSGVDLTRAFVEAAEVLTAAVGLAARVRVHHADALALPFADLTFDRAYSQNVVMNVADKLGFYREALRVLRPGGVLVLSNLCAGTAGEPLFPVPWAESAATSFLSTPEQTRADLEAAGFTAVEVHDTTEAVLPRQAAMRRRLEREGFPPLGLHVLMGERMRELQINSMRSIEESRARTVEVVARRPG